MKEPVSTKPFNIEAMEEILGTSRIILKMLRCARSTKEATEFVSYLIKEYENQLKIEYARQS